MKVLLLRADSLRHKYLSSVLAEYGFLAGEIIEQKKSENLRTNSSLVNFHFLARDQAEIDFFGPLKAIDSSIPRCIISSGELGSPPVESFIDATKFDIAITFGTSILRQPLIDKLNDNIMGIHLGLSPYYRGSGTNFFPFVNAELAAVGYTLMHLNNEIDKGPIIHQGRAPLVLGDSIHTIGNRNIKMMTSDIISLLKINVLLASAITPPNVDGKLYRRSDFNDTTLKNALDNLKMGLLENYLINQQYYVSRFPIVQNSLLRTSN